MKKLIIFSVVFFVAAGAYAFQTIDIQEKVAAKSDSISITTGDTTEYELIVMDIGFHSWFITNRKPKWYYEKWYYHNKNTFYTINWNNRVIENMHRPPYEFQIDYDQKTDYGIDLEWQLSSGRSGFSPTTLRP